MNTYTVIGLYDVHANEYHAAGVMVGAVDTVDSDTGDDMRRMVHVVEAHDPDDAEVQAEELAHASATD